MMRYLWSWKETSWWSRGLPVVHCFGVAGCDGLKTFVPCWVTILSGKWNLELSTGQEDPTSPEAKFIQAFLCARQMSCSIYAERNTPVYCVGFLPTPILNFPYFNLVCLYSKIPIICSRSCFSCTHISTRQSSNIPPAGFSFLAVKLWRLLSQGFLYHAQRDLFNSERRSAGCKAAQKFV